MNHKKKLAFPSEISVSTEAVDLMRRLMCEAGIRIGRDGVDAIKSHPWFKDIDWATLRSQPAPITVTLENPTDTRNFETDYDKAPPPKSFPKARDFSGNHLPFVGFTFVRREGLERMASQTGVPRPIERQMSMTSRQMAAMQRDLQAKSACAAWHLMRRRRFWRVRHRRGVRRVLTCGRRRLDESARRCGEAEAENQRLSRELTNAARGMRERGRLRRSVDRATIAIPLPPGGPTERAWVC